MLRASPCCVPVLVSDRTPAPSSFACSASSPGAGQQSAPACAGDQAGANGAALAGAKSVRFSGPGAGLEPAAAPQPEGNEPVLKPEAGRLLAGLLHGLQADLRAPVCSAPQPPPHTGPCRTLPVRCSAVRA